MKYIGCWMAIFLAGSAYAAVPATQVKPQPAAKILAGEGMTYGGLAGGGFTLLDVRRTSDAKKKMERIVIDVGDLQGASMRGWPGYYFAELKKNPNQLVIDFSQMPKTRIDQEKIAERLSGSLGVTKTTMALDPVDNSLNLTMDLKKNTKAKVYQVFGKQSTSKVVIDLFTE